MTQPASPQSVLNEYIEYPSQYQPLILVQGLPEQVAEFRNKCFRDYPPGRRGGLPTAYVNVFDYNGIIPRHPSTEGLFNNTERSHDYREVAEYMEWVIGAADHFRLKSRPHKNDFREAFYKEAPTTSRNAALLWASVFHPDLVAQARAEHRFTQETGDPHWIAHHARVWGSPLNAQHTQWVIDQPTALVFFFSVQPARHAQIKLAITQLDVLLTEMCNQHPRLRFSFMEHGDMARPHGFEFNRHCKAIVRIAHAEVLDRIHRAMGRVGK